MVCRGKYERNSFSYMQATTGKYYCYKDWFD